MIHFTRIQYSDKWTKIGVGMWICWGNSQDNFQLHRFTRSENTAKSFRGATFWAHTVYLQSLGLYLRICPTPKSYTITKITYINRTSNCCTVGPWHPLQNGLHAEIGAILQNFYAADSGASFSYRCMTSNDVDCLWDPETINDVRSRASVRKTGAWVWRRI